MLYISHNLTSVIYLHSFFQAAVVLILLYRCTTWTLTKQLEKKLDGNYTKMLRAILNKSWRQDTTKHQLYGHIPPITKTIQVRWTRHVGHCWRSRDKLISYVLLWAPTYGRAKAGWPARTYIQQLCEDTGCSPEDLPETMNDRLKWRVRVRDICASGMTWWWLVCTLYSTRLIDRTLSGATTLGLSGAGSNGNEEVFHIPQILNLAIRWLSVISRTLVLPSLHRCSQCILQSQPTGLFFSSSYIKKKKNE